MFIAAEHKYGEALAWHGSGSKKPGLCWVPEISSTGQFKGACNVKGNMNLDYKPEGSRGKLKFEQDKGITILASEYVIT